MIEIALRDPAGIRRGRAEGYPIIMPGWRDSEGSRMEAAHAREDLAGAIDQALVRLRVSHEQISNLDIKRIVDDQSKLIEVLQAELEQARRRLTQT